MTTAHRPTFHPAVAQAGAGYYRYYAPRRQISQRALPGDMRLNLRPKENLEKTLDGGVSREELLASLELREAEHFQNLESELRRRGAMPYSTEAKLPQIAQELRRTQDVKGIQDFSSTDGGGGGGRIEGEEGKEEEGLDTELDRIDWDQFDDFSSSDDDDDDDDSSDDDDSDDDDDDDDDDEEAELLREVERIRAEREAEKERELARLQAEKQQEINRSILSGNPLLEPQLEGSRAQGSTGEEESFEIKRRWDDDVVFRNQSRNAPVKSRKRFINDTIRSDFHRKFLERYIK